MLGAGIAFLTIGMLLVAIAVAFFIGLFGVGPKESALAGMIMSLIG
jgi:hypothetical protein